MCNFLAPTSSEFESEILGSYPFMIELWSIIIVPLNFHQYNDMKCKTTRTTLNLIAAQVKRLKLILGLQNSLIIIKLIFTVLMVFKPEIYGSSVSATILQLFSCTYIVILAEAVTYSSQKSVQGFSHAPTKSPSSKTHTGDESIDEEE